MASEATNEPNGIAAKIATNGALAMIGGMVGKAKQSFRGTQANEILLDVSSSLPVGTADYIHAAKAKFFNLAFLRSPKVYLGIGDERPFYLERDASLLAGRMRHNLSFFYLNYLLLAAVLFVLTLLVSPGAIVGIVLLAVCWAAMIRATSSGSARVVGVVVSQKQAAAGMSIFSVCLLLYILKNVFWWTLSTSGILIGLHVFFRDASMHKDEGDRVEMSGDYAAEEGASFLADETIDLE